MFWHVETVCILSKLSSAKEHIEVTVDMDELDLTSAEAKATYNEIRNWVQEHYGEGDIIGLSRKDGRETEV